MLCGIKNLHFLWPSYTVATQSIPKLQYLLCPLLLHMDLCVCFAEKPELPPTSLLLTTPTQKEIDNGTATFICLATHFSPKSHTFKWTHENQDLGTKVKGTILSQDKGAYTAISILEISAHEWTGSSSPVKCEFQQKKWKGIEEASYGMCYMILLLLLLL